MIGTDELCDSDDPPTGDPGLNPVGAGCLPGCVLGIYDLWVWPTGAPTSRRAMHEAVFDCGKPLFSLIYLLNVGFWSTLTAQGRGLGISWGCGIISLFDSLYTVVMKPTQFKKLSLTGMGLGLIPFLTSCSSSSSSLVVTPDDPSSSEPSVTLLAEGLDSPRGITMGPEGQLYVAEAGRGPQQGFDPTLPVVPSPSVPGAQLQFGNTGAISRIDPVTGEVERILTNLPSVAIPAGEPVFDPALGADALGPTDVTFAADGQIYFLIGLGTDPANREVLNAPDLGSLVTADLSAANPNSTVSYIADLASVEESNNPDGTDVISNPYSVLVSGSEVFVIDAGANVLLRSDRSGAGVTVDTVFDDIRFFPNPGIPGVPDPIPMQQVPTAITQDLNGDFFVSELTGLPFPVGEARIFQLQGSQPTVALTGFTNLVDIEFDSQGNLWVLEYDSDSLLGEAPFGVLIRVAPDGQRTTLLRDLITPTSVTVGDDQTIYVTNQGFFAGAGEILKIEFE